MKSIELRKILRRMGSMAYLLLFGIIVFSLSKGQAGDDPSRQRLNESPRHHEWVEVRHNGRTVHAFLVYPETKEKVPVVIVIHENRGLTDWIRSMADQLAEAGFIALAPDLLSGMGPGGGRTSGFTDEDAAREAISKLDPQQVMADLQAVADYAKKLEAGNGRFAVAGFCWGGAQTFRFATNREDLAATFVFYGTAPIESEAIARIKAPVYGFYGGNDAHITGAVPAVTDKMKAAGKTFDPVVYEGAGHAFMRSGVQAPANHPNRKARDAAWKRWLELLRKI